MRFGHAILLSAAAFHVPATTAAASATSHGNSNKTISQDLFNELEELARLVDISYCVGDASLGIHKPFSCASRCNDFKDYELVTVRLFILPSK